jgi:hypothetical protein
MCTLKKIVAVWLALTGIAAAQLGCSSGGSNGGASAFEGSWSCTTTVNGKTGPAETFVITESTDGTLTATGTGSSNGSCSTFKLSVSGDVATIEPGQSCAVNSSLALPVSGSLTVNGTSLTGTLTVSGTGVNGMVSDSISYSCLKQ